MEHWHKGCTLEAAAGKDPSNPGANADVRREPDAGPWIYHRQQHQGQQKIGDWIGCREEMARVPNWVSPHLLEQVGECSFAAEKEGGGACTRTTRIAGWAAQIFHSRTSGTRGVTSCPVHSHLFWITLQSLVCLAVRRGGRSGSHEGCYQSQKWVRWQTLGLPKKSDRQTSLPTVRAWHQDRLQLR